MTSDITIEQFEDLVAAYGAQPDRWPDVVGGATRADALSLSVRDPRARRLLEEARILDRALDRAADVEAAPSALRQAILNIPGANPAGAPAEVSVVAEKWSWWPFGNVFGGPVPQLSGLALACLLGLILGTADIADSPWGQADLTEMAMGLDTPAALASWEGLEP